MYMNRVELPPSVVSRQILPLWQSDVFGSLQKKSVRQKTGRALIQNYIEKKYSVLVREIREGGNISYVISRLPASKGMEARSFVVEKYSHEHMMRQFARYLNQGRLSKKNIDETIIEMKLLQEFCR